jgi:hypothetical protein
MAKLTVVPSGMTELFLPIKLEDEVYIPVILDKWERQVQSFQRKAV